MRRLALAALLGLAPAAGRAQDLESEVAIELRPEIRAIEGSQPYLVSCDLVQGGALDCRADRPIRQARCRSDDSAALPLKVVVKGESIVCQPRPGSRELVTGLKIYLLSEDDRFSEWLVRSTSPAQAARLYKAEMQAVHQSADRMPPYRLGAITQLFSSSFPDYAIYAGIDARMDFTERLFGRLRYARPLQQGSSARFDVSQALLGVRQRLSPSWVAEVEFGHRSMGEFGIRGLSSAELGAGLRWDLWPGWLHLDGKVRAQWPEVEALRQSVEFVSRAEIGPFGHWSIDFELSAGSRVWDDSRSRPSGLTTSAQLGVSWVN